MAHCISCHKVETEFFGDECDACADERERQREQKVNDYYCYLLLGMQVEVARQLVKFRSLSAANFRSTFALVKDQAHRQDKVVSAYQPDGAIALDPVEHETALTRLYEVLYGLIEEAIDESNNRGKS
jgi:hypothetical protein